MIRKGFYILIISLVILTGSELRAESGKQTLDSLIQVALEKNPDVLAADYSQKSADYRARSAGVIPDPMVTVAAMNLPRRSLSLGETPMSGYAVGLTQPLPWPGRLRAKKAIAKLKSESEGQQLAATQNSIIRSVEHDYYEYSYWVMAEDIIDKNIQLMQSLSDISEVIYENGEGSAQDFLRAQTMLARLENRKRQIVQMSQTALLQLGQSIDDMSIVDRQLPPYLPDDLEIIPDIISVDSTLNNPMLVKAGLGKDIADKKISLAHADYWPDFTFGLDYSFRKDMPTDPVHGEDYITARVGLRLPLWFLSKQRNNSASARLARNKADEKYRSLQNRLEQQIASTRLALKTISENAAQYHDDITPQAQAAYEAARVAYENGQVNFNTLLSAQLDLLDIELEELTLTKQFGQKTAELNELTGER
jgi:cobalt-zinc-cadmium efflux system outer membrane protein